MAYALNRCMQCKRPPTHEILFAEGKGHAWFCDEHYQQWVKENPGEIVSERPVVGGAVDRQWTRKEKALLEEKGIWDTIAKYEGVMVAFFVPPEIAQDLEGRRYPTGSDVTPAGDMHVTLAYIPEIDDIAKGTLIQSVSEIAQGQGAISATLGGIGRFLNPQGDDRDAYYASVDAPALPAFRQCLVECLESRGITIATNHGFTPHCTLAYIPSEAQTPDVLYKPIECTFDTLWVSWGDERVSFPMLGEPIAQRIVKAIRAFAETIPIDGIMGEIEGHLKSVERAFSDHIMWPERNIIIEKLGTVLPLSRPAVTALTDAIKEENHDAAC